MATALQLVDDRIDLSLTDFIDFAIKSGTPKLSKVREIKGRGPYHPATDYWKAFRDFLQDRLETSHFSKSALITFANEHRDPKKTVRYHQAAAGFAKFLGRKETKWFSPPHALWTPSRLRVRINPELGLTINSQRYAIKLYFKNDKLSMLRIDLLTFLMRNQLGTANPQYHFGVLEMATGTLFKAKEPAVDLMPLLLGEAASFASMWDALGER